MAADEWLSAEAAARYMNLPASTIYVLIRDDQLAARHSPVRVRRQDLDACLEGCRVRAGQIAHLNQYAEGASRPGTPPTTAKGYPDRRYGPRIQRSRGEAERGMANVVRRSRGYQITAPRQRGETPSRREHQ